MLDYTYILQLDHKNRSEMLYLYTKLKIRYDMQHRMKTHQLAAEQIDSLLKDGLVGSLATINETGDPYVTPIHYFYPYFRNTII